MSSSNNTNTKRLSVDSGNSHDPAFVTMDDDKKKQSKALAPPDFGMEKRRSLSVDNLAACTLTSCYEDIPSNRTPNYQTATPEKSQLNSTQGTGITFKGLKKRMQQKMTKSHTDLYAAQNVTSGSPSKTAAYSAGITTSGDSKNSPHGTRKHISRDQVKKNSRSELGTVSDSSVDKPGIGERYGDADHIKPRRGRCCSIDSTDQSLIRVSVASYENLDDASSTYETDETDGPAISLLYSAQKIEKLFKKIEKTREELLLLQANKDENVAEYLKSTDNSHETATNAKIKLNFERNNQKSNIGIQLLQRKLEKYQQQVKELEAHGVQGTKRIMKVVQDSVRSGASSFTGAVAKPLESFNKIMKKEKKCSSTENVYITVTDNDEEMERHYYYTSDEENFSDLNCSANPNLMRKGVLENIRRQMQNSAEKGEEELNFVKSKVENLEQKTEELKQEVEKYKDMLNRLLQSMQEEKFKTDQQQNRLNDLYNQWNDLTELHQNEMRGMQDELDRTVERIECVEYRFTERTAELDENVENCGNRISKLEKNQQEQQQPIDTYLDMDAKILLTKIISFIINICVVFLFVISSMTKLVMPFVSNRTRLVATVIAITAVVVLWKYSDSEIFSRFRGLFRTLER